MSTSSAVRRLIMRALLASAFTTALSTLAGAQTTVTGTVTNEGRLPVPLAVVSIRGVRASATTNDAGVYRLVIPADRSGSRTDTLRISRLGYRQANVPFTMATGDIRVDVTLQSQAVALEQVVVTGTAGNQQRKAQPAVVATIDAADIMTKAPIQNVNQLLYAREAGVVLTSASGTSGANTRIDIRGQASVSLSNYPLVFVDGVRMTAGPRGVAQAPGGATSGAGGQIFNALNDLNPDDIESIEIVKGPAASTLYGAEASAGVIQILTKKGRAGSRHLSQSAMFERDGITPNFTPLENFAACSAALVAPTSTNPLCRGQAVGAIISDNPIARLGAFGDGHANQLQYSLSGGGESYGFFGSFSALNEHGTTAGSDLNHRSGRSNFQWTPTETVAFEAGVGVSRADDKLPQGDQSSYGYLINGGFGSPTTVSTGPNGQMRGGLLNNNLNVNAISAIKTENVTLRSTPSARLRYTPLPWFTHRVTLGADFVRTSAFQQYPKNDSTWYSTSLNTGSIARSEINSTVYTVDYLGNINKQFRSGAITSDLSFGSQWINSVTETLNGAGLGLLVNSNNVVSAATTSTVSQGYDQSKSFGLLAQEQIGFRDRLFLQVGARWDRNSAFNEDLGSFFLPKAGISYVVSQEPMWQRSMPSWWSTLRLRTAYGETGRSPSSTASLQTYGRANIITDAGTVLPGVTPGSPGNAELKPERGTEIEAGFDAAFFRDRVGIEFTYFNKTSRDLLLSLPLAPSSGFASSPFVNIGKMTNKGLEVALRATPVERQNFTWNTGLNLNTLRNRIISMGSVTPFVSANNQCFKPGVEVAAWCVLQVVRVDSAAGRAIVSDTAEVVGGQLPKLTSNWNTTLTLFRRVTLYGLLDGKWGHRVYNLTDDLRDRSLRNSKGTVAPADQGGYGTVERLRRLGPFVTATTGTGIGAPSVRGDYIESGDFVRLRELSATILIPPSLLRQVRVSSASLSVGGSNLKLWTKYGGFDPEVIGVVDPVTPYFAEVFTTPIARRVFARINFQF